MTADPRRLAWIAAAIVMAPLLGYPVFALAGGLPHFPADGDCGPPPEEGRPVNVVFDRFDSPVEAEKERERVLAFGFVGTNVEPDDCGRWLVVLGNVPSVEVAREVAEEARSVDLDPALELDPDW